VAEPSSAPARRTAAMARPRVRIAVAFGTLLVIALPGLVLRLGGIEPPAPVGVLAFGATIVAAAFALAWAGEAAESEISSALAIGLLAVIAILPEYAVDLYFAYVSGQDPAMAAYAAANMTGSNRLLLGIGWPVAVLAAYLVWRRRRGRAAAAGVALPVPRRRFAVALQRGYELELGLLLVASVLSLIVPLTGQLNLVLGVALLALFIWYLYRASLGQPAETEHRGVALALTRLPRRSRRIALVAVFAASAAVILVCAEAFAGSLVQTGRVLRVDDFLLVQWLAPLASEAPEFIVALLFAARGRGALALGMLLASKVNQWTALVGSLPIAHLVGGGGWSLPMDGRQIEEFVLTIAQTLLGVAVLLDGKLSGRWAVALFALFALTFVFPTTQARWLVAAGYALVAIAVFLVNRSHLWRALRAPFAPAPPLTARSE